MNNVLPSCVHLHEKYDLKGSTYKRQASRLELLKAKPTLKDLDFLRLHPHGLMVQAEAYQALVRTIERDCRVSTTFQYSQFKPVWLFLVGKCQCISAVSTVCLFFCFYQAEIEYFTDCSVQKLIYRIISC